MNENMNNISASELSTNSGGSYRKRRFTKSMFIACMSLFIFGTCILLLFLNLVPNFEINSTTQNNHVLQPLEPNSPTILSSTETPILETNPKTANDISGMVEMLRNVKTLDELKQFFNTPQKINPNNDSKAFSTFLSVSTHPRKAFEYMIGVLTLFQSLIENSKASYPFILVVVPPRMNEAKGLSENVVVQKTVQVIKDLLQSIHTQDLPRFRIYIASYITNPTEGKHMASNNVENRYIDTFNKLHMWKLDEFHFQKILYFDADVVALKPQIEHLFECGYFCAVSDLCIPEYFNGGLMVLKPSSERFQDMIEKLTDPSFQSYDGGEQGFINRYFEFNRKSRAWPLREQALRSSEDFSKALSTVSKDQQLLDDIYRLPFHFNGQIQLAFLSKEGWQKKYGDAFVAIHMTIPVKPWSYYAFPVLDPSYMWYPYFVKTHIYRIVPWNLVIFNTVMTLLCVITISATIWLLRRKRSISGYGTGAFTTTTTSRTRVLSVLKSILEWLSKPFEHVVQYHLKNHILPKSMTNRQNSTQSSSSSIFMTIWYSLILTWTPFVIALVCLLLIIYMYMEIIYTHNYDPHSIWGMKLWTAISCCVWALSVYSLWLSQLTEKVLNQLCKESPQLNEKQDHDMEQMNSTILDMNNECSTLKQQVKGYLQWLACFYLIMIPGYFSIMVVHILTLGEFAFHVIYLTWYGMLMGWISIWKILNPLSHQVMLFTHDMWQQKREWMAIEEQYFYDETSHEMRTNGFFKTQDKEPSLEKSPHILAAQSEP